MFQDNISLAFSPQQNKKSPSANASNKINDPWFTKNVSYTKYGIYRTHLCIMRNLTSGEYMVQLTRVQHIYLYSYTHM